MALIVSGSTFELREVSLREKPADMLAASPKGTVPVLILPDGKVIDESLDIMRWALRRSDPENWLAGEDLALIGANDGPFKRHLDRYKYSRRDAGEAADARATATSLLAVLEDRLQRHSYICGPGRSLTDIALMPFVRQFAEVDRTWFDSQPMPALQRWLHFQLASPLFVEAMRKQPRSEGCGRSL